MKDSKRASREAWLPVGEFALESSHSSRQNLFDTIFHGFVNLLVELVALTLAFIFFLSKEEEKLVGQAVERQAYEEMTPVYSKFVNEKYNEVCTVSSCLASEIIQQQQQQKPAPIYPALDLSQQTMAIVLNSMKEIDPETNGAAVQNRWVLRVSIILMAMGFIVFAASYTINRLARGPTVNLHRIVAYNVVLLLVALGLQVAFMFFITLRYVPSLPSDRLKSFRERLQVRFGEARLNKAGGSGFAVDDKALLTQDALFSNSIIIGIILVIALIMFLAWRTKAYQHVTFLQSLCIQTLFIGGVVVGMYFLLKKTVAPKVERRVMDDLAKHVVSRAVLAEDDGRDIEATMTSSIDDKLKSDEEADEKTKARNAELTGTLIRVIAIAAAALLLIIIFTSVLQSKQRFKRFFVSLLLVGLVGASTSLLVEFGFGYNILANFIPANAGRIVNDTIDNITLSTRAHAEWFTQQSCALGPLSNSPQECMDTGPGREVWRRRTVKA